MLPLHHYPIGPVHRIAHRLGWQHSEDDTVVPLLLISSAILAVATISVYLYSSTL